MQQMAERSVAAKVDLDCALWGDLALDLPGSKGVGADRLAIGGPPETLRCHLIFSTVHRHRHTMIMRVRLVLDHI
jgi:hypothetical protein